MNNRTFTRTWRFTLIITVGWIIFWGWFYLTHGFIPSVDTAYIVLPFSNFAVLKLSAPISRLIDILIGPIWASTLVVLIQKIPMDRYNNPKTDWGWIVLLVWIGILIGFFDGLIIGLPSGIATSLFLGAILGLLGSLLMGVINVIEWARA